LDFLSSLANQLFVWLKMNFWKFLLDKYSLFLLTGGEGSPVVLHLEGLLVQYEQFAFNAVSQTTPQLRHTLARRRLPLVQKICEVCHLNRSEFLRCFLRPGYLVPTLEQLESLGVEQALLTIWRRKQQQRSNLFVATGVTKRVCVVFNLVRKLWKLLLTHLATSIPDFIPDLIVALADMFTTTATCFDYLFRQNCWINYLIDKFAAKQQATIGRVVLARAASLPPSQLSLAVFRRLNFVDWPSSEDAKKCASLVELTLAFVGPPPAAEPPVGMNTCQATSKRPLVSPVADNGCGDLFSVAKAQRLLESN